MPTGVTPAVRLNPSSTGVALTYPATSADVGADSEVALTLDGADESNYSLFDVPGFTSTAAAWIDAFSAYVFSLPIEIGENSFNLTYDGNIVWSFVLTRQS